MEAIVNQLVDYDLEGQLPLALVENAYCHFCMLCILVSQVLQVELLSLSRGIQLSVALLLFSLFPSYTSADEDILRASSEPLILLGQRAMQPFDISELIASFEQAPSAGDVIPLVSESALEILAHVNSYLDVFQSLTASMVLACEPEIEACIRIEAASHLEALPSTDSKSLGDISLGSQAPRPPEGSKPAFRRDRNTRAGLQSATVKFEDRVSETVLPQEWDI